jgi:hypothetical protein
MCALPLPAAAAASDHCAGGVAVAVMDVRRPLKSTEDAITKVSLCFCPPRSDPNTQLQSFFAAFQHHSCVISHLLPQEAERVSNGGTGGATLALTRFLDNGAEVGLHVTHHPALFTRRALSGEGC